MHSEKEKALHETYERFITVSLSEQPPDSSAEFTHRDMMGFDASQEERILSFSEYKELISRQPLEKGIERHYKVTPVLRRIADDEHTAVMVDEIGLPIPAQGDNQAIRLRLNTVLTFSNEKWTITHWHGSIPLESKGGNDAWSNEEWKSKYEELQKRLTEKTADLTLRDYERAVEVALEVVRKRSAAMRATIERNEVIAVLIDQLGALGCDPAAFIVILWDENKRMSESWIAGHTPLELPLYFEIPFTDHPLFSRFDDALKKGAAHAAFELSAAEKEKLNSLFFPSPVALPGEARKTWAAKEVVFGTSALMEWGSINCLTPGLPLSRQQAEGLTRFATVFEQVYTRFLDLKTAEGQLREQRVQAALDRVRTRTMAMNHSDEMAEAAGLLYSELIKLGVLIISCGYVLVDKESTVGSNYMASPEGSFELEAYSLAHVGSDVMQRIYNSWLKPDPYCVTELKGQENIDHHTYVAGHATNFPWPAKKYLSHIPEDSVINTINFTHGYLSVQGIEPYTPAELDMLVRFGKVFDLTYRRFLDIKKAEAQARESQIEAALERIRARALTMNASGDLIDVANVLWEQMALLGQPEIEASAVHLYTDKSDTFESWYALHSPKGDGGHLIKGTALFRIGTSVLAQEWLTYFRSYKDEYTVHASGAKLAEWRIEVHESAREIEATWGSSPPREQYFHFSDFSGGSLVMVSPQEPTEEAKALQKRTASVFDLAYRRFADLKKAELQSYKAKIEVALERVRARALAMHQPEELKQVAKVLRHEMGFLGVEELETCSIYIKDEHVQTAECWYAIKDIRTEEKSLLSDHFKLDLNDTWVGREMLRFYNSSNDQISIEMTGAGRKEWITYCEQLSPMLRGYYGDTIPDRTYHLYKFSQGAIGVASAGNISEESWGLLKRTASAFSLAYSRFKDLTKAQTDLEQLKLAKQKAEEALTELKATQSQLIHAEKMASLGELTAGIAHEIQNPLNFVNNFSDLSHELLEEMMDELKNNNHNEAVEIASDVVKNLEKILHHGKRADVIVKGMLQHSRSGSGAKELTDINLLADEYLRLAYHGLRAKDKTFSAGMKTDFDKGIGNINILQQDIGRVILNLITNAFYTVTEKKKLLDANEPATKYEPMVTVGTKMKNDTVEVTVADNGNGIPEQVLKKIFQPFFTTKPTGQGTGLGLSLSYDIVKAHGGELKVETQEGEGSVFIVRLPVI